MAAIRDEELALMACLTAGVLNQQQQQQQQQRTRGGSPFHILRRP